MGFVWREGVFCEGGVGVWGGVLWVDRMYISLGVFFVLGFVLEIYGFFIVVFWDI